MQENGRLNNNNNNCISPTAMVDEGNVLVFNNRELP
jgi:hypothetical protein